MVRSFHSRVNDYYIVGVLPIEVGHYIALARTPSPVNILVLIMYREQTHHTYMGGYGRIGPVE